MASGGGTNASKLFCVSAPPTSCGDIFHHFEESKRLKLGKGNMIRKEDLGRCTGAECHQISQKPK